MLDTVLAERSVVRAARRLHVTPRRQQRWHGWVPDILRGAEAADRSHPRAGNWRRVARALRDLDQAVSGTAFDPASATRQFTLAIADSGQLVRLPRLASLLDEEMPRTQLRVVGIDTLLSSGGLGGTEVDVVAGALPEQGPGIHMAPLYEEHTVLVVRRNHPRVRDRISKPDLASLRHVDVQALPAAVDSRRCAPRHPRRPSSSFTTAAAVVAATDFVATLPASVVEVLGDRLGIRAVASPVRRLTVEIKLAWHERTDQDPAMRAFRDVVTRAVARRRPATRLAD